MKLRIMGAGASSGVPYVSGDWGQCDPSEPKNRRSRASVLIESEGARIVVDTGPDFREQFIAAGSGPIDGIIYTHGHADHVHGIDDIRAINSMMKQQIPAFGYEECLDEITRRFSYVFAEPNPERGWFRPSLGANPIESGDLRIGDADLRVFEQDHGVCRTIGVRVGDVAYSTDVVHLDAEALHALKGVKTWIVGCLRREAHFVHAGLEQVEAWADQIGPERVILTHMNASMDYADLMGELPNGIEPGYDGLVIEG
ncbi:MAG: MBL fold metallo-hydrolase [Alphaproteobacteria bacterium]